MAQTSSSKQPKGPKSSGVQPIYGWSDDVLNKLVENIRVPKIQDDMKTVRSVLLRFWHYYVTGDKPEGASRQSIIYSAILCSVVPSIGSLKYLFPERNYNCEGKKEFFKLGKLPTLESKFEWEYKSKIPNRIDLFKKSSGNTTSAQLSSSDAAVRGMTEEKIKETFAQYEDKNYLDFTNYLKKIFDEWDGTKELTGDAFYLFKITSVISIMCMKALVKNSTVLENTFSRKKINSSIRNIMHSFQLGIYVPPCKEFISEIKRCLDKNNTHTKTMFTIILHRFTSEKLKDNECNHDIIHLLSFSCLISTSYNGLQVIKLLLSAKQKRRNLNLTDFKKFYYTDETKEAWITIDRFINEICCSIPWCRLVDHNYYADLSHDKVAPIIVWLGSILFHDPEWTEVFSSGWGKKFFNQYKYERNYGILFYNLFQQANEENFAVSPEAQSLLNCAKQKMSPKVCTDLEKFLKSYSVLLTEQLKAMLKLFETFRMKSSTLLSAGAKNMIDHYDSEPDEDLLMVDSDESFYYDSD